MKSSASTRSGPRSTSSTPGSTPIIEKDIGEIIAEQVAAGRLRATTERRRGGAPHRPRLRLRRHAEPPQRRPRPASTCAASASRSATALRDHHGAPVVVMRSTMLPGTMRERRDPGARSGSRAKRAGEDFGVCINPEFLREGTAVHDYFAPAQDRDRRARTARAATCWPASTPASPRPLIRTDIETAEMVKYADNAWHALKVGFANEIGNLCKGARRRQPPGDGHLLPGHEAQPLALLPEARLRLRRLVPAQGPARAALQGEDAGRLACRSSARSCRSNAAQIERGVQRGGRARAAARSASSASASRPAPTTCARARWWSSTERLIGKGYDLRIYDRNVSLARIHGANRDYILNRIPHISRLMVPSMRRGARPRAAPSSSATPRRSSATCPGASTDGQTIIDFVRMCDSRSIAGVYEGICW